MGTIMLCLILILFFVINKNWDLSLKHIQNYLKNKGRQNLSRLKLGLLEPEILHRLGRQEEARTLLEAYRRRTMEPLFSAISETLENDHKILF